jgi:hypothetical protein
MPRMQAVESRDLHLVCFEYLCLDIVFIDSVFFLRYLSLDPRRVDSTFAIS